MRVTGRLDPGPCPICGAAHTACTADVGPIVMAPFPQRDALHLEAQPIEPPVELVVPPPEPVPVSFSTAEYRRATHGPKARR